MARRHSRKEFTPRDKAAIFARDRATCVYSGKSLWALDHGFCPLVQWDWVDHVKPSRRGGGVSLDNGVCASHTYNMKKRANGADRFMLMDPENDGAPSRDYLEYFGEISVAWQKQLQRLAKVEARDWFFNRAICNLNEACDLSFRRPGHGRKPLDCIKAALNKFREFREEGHPSGSAKDLKKRGLVSHPKREDTRICLKLIEATTIKDIMEHMPVLRRIYAANARALSAFWDASTLSDMEAVVRKARRDPDITPAVLKALSSHLTFWRADKRCRALLD